MFFQLLVLFACASAGVLQLLTARKVVDSRSMLRAARRVTGVALLSAALYMGYTLYFFGAANPVYCWILGLISLGQILFAMNTFMDPHEAEALIQSIRQKARNEATHA